MVSLVELIVEDLDNPKERISYVAKRIARQLANSGIERSPKTILLYLSAYRRGERYSEKRKKELQERGFSSKRAYRNYLREQNKNK